MSLHVKNWEKHQHGSSRTYPWIKMHLSLLRDADILALPDAAQFLLMRLWMAAASANGQLSDSYRTAIRQACVRHSSTMPKYFKLLQDKGFLVTDASSSKRRVREEKRTTPAIQPAGREKPAPQTNPIPEKPAVIHMDPGGDPEFLVAWKIFPLREGGNPKSLAAKAWARRRREGMPAAEMLAGVERYAECCRREGKIGTPYVMQAATFFGPDKRWQESYAATIAIPADLQDWVTQDSQNWTPGQREKMAGYLSPARARA